MVKHRSPELEVGMKQALAELQSLITQSFPDARFRVTRSPEDREIVLLQPVVDIEDRDAVLDIIIDRLVELQTDQDLPLFVVPARPQPRNVAVRLTERRGSHAVE